MKNYLIPFLFMATLTFSCEKDNCSQTVVDSLEVTFRGEITVVNSSGFPLGNYPIRIIFQKHWCDGDTGFPAELPGFTDMTGIWAYDIDYTFNNEDDYIMVQFYAGTGDDELGYSAKYEYDLVRVATSTSWPKIFNARHEFVVN